MSSPFFDGTPDVETMLESQENPSNRSTRKNIQVSPPTWYKTI